MPKPRKLDAVTEKQALAFVQKHNEFGGGPSRNWELWRSARKLELCGQFEPPEELLCKFKEMNSRLAQVEAHSVPEELYHRITRTRHTLRGVFANMNTSFASPTMILNKAALARLIADAERGNPHADQLLRELAAEHLRTGQPAPKPMADYAATTLCPPSGRKKTRQRSLKRSNDHHLAQLVYAVGRKFGLKPTRNRDPKNTKADYSPDCACSIVAKSTKLSSSTVEKAWDHNKDFARASRDFVAELIELEHDLDQVLCPHPNPSSSKQAAPVFQRLIKA